MNRLKALNQVTVFGNFTQSTDDIGFRFKIHGEIRIVPVTENTQSLKIITLRIYLGSGILATFLSELGGSNLLSRLTNKTFNLKFDWQTVTVPAWNVRSIKTAKGL